MSPWIIVAVCLSGVLPLPASPAPWGPGCNDRILNSRFALAEAPYFPCGVERQIFIYQVIDKMKNGYGGTMVCEPSPHPHLDSPEFVSCYLRTFSAPSGKLHEYDYRFDRLLSRLCGAAQTMEDPRLDWDVWRAWLLFENRGSVNDSFESEPGTMETLESSRELLWQYLEWNAAAILTDPQRRTWWITRLTEDMEARGGRPMRRWFLLQLIAASDPTRPVLEEVPMPEKLVRDVPDMGKIFLRQPHPLDPFLHLGGRAGTTPPFEEALWQMASAVGLGLEIRGVTSRSLPATRIHEVSLEMTKWALDRSFVINQESWSKTGGDVRLAGWEWGVRFSRPMGRRAAFSSVQFPERADRSDGVFFFVFQKRLYVWPKAKMDAAVLQMLDTAGLADSAMTNSFAARGFTPLKTILSK